MPQAAPRFLRDTPLHVEVAGSTPLPPTNAPVLVFMAGGTFVPFQAQLADPSITLGDLIGLENSPFVA